MMLERYIKDFLRKEIMSDLAKMLTENQKEMLKLIAAMSKKQPGHQIIKILILSLKVSSQTETSTPI